MKIIIIGVGSENFGDDYIGLAILKKIKERNFIKNANFIEIDKTSLNIIDYISENNLILIIDAVKMGLNPAEFKIFNINDLKDNTTKNSFTSSHQFGILENLYLAKSIGLKVENIFIFGVEPKKIFINEDLSDELKRNLEIYCKKIEEFIEQKQNHYLYHTIL